MLRLIGSALFLMLIFAQDVVHADGALPYASKALRVRANDNSYLNLVKGLFRSNRSNFVKYLQNIPCEEIHSLEEDVDKATKFVEQLKNGQRPSIFAGLPQEELQQFEAVINIALSLPDELKNPAEAAATDAVKVFNDIEDGTIMNDIENLSGVNLSDITSALADFTNELTGVWGVVTSDVGCVFRDCPKPTTAVHCGATAAATTMSDGAATTTQDAAQRTTQIPPYPTGTTSLVVTSIATAATAQNAAQRTPQSPPHPTGTTSLVMTSTATAVTTQNAAQRTTQSPTPFTGAASLASTQSNWAGLSILMAIAVGLNTYALYL